MYKYIANVSMIIGVNLSYDYSQQRYGSRNHFLHDNFTSYFVDDIFGVPMRIYDHIRSLYNLYKIEINR